MDFRHSLLLAVCIAAVIAAGCTNTPQAPATPTSASTSTVSSGTPVMIPAAGTTIPCGNDTCSFVPTFTSSAPGTSLIIEASPHRYSPLMSSTPGIGLTLNVTGFNVSDAEFTWNASHGQFLSWDAPDYRVNQLGATASNSGQKLFWSFTDKPVSTREPVVITVSAKDPVSGLVLGTSTVILEWDGDTAVTVQDN